MKKLLLIFALFTGLISFGQEYAYIDFGGSSHTTPGNWNNIVVSNQNETGVTENLINSSGASMGIVFTLTDSFDHINNNARYIRHELSQILKNQLRKTPELHFYIDDSFEYAKNIDNLLK